MNSLTQWGIKPPTFPVGLHERLQTTFFFRALDRIAEFPINHEFNCHESAEASWAFRPGTVFIDTTGQTYKLPDFDPAIEA